MRGKVTELSEVTVAEMLGLAPFLVSVSVQTDWRWLTHVGGVMAMSEMTVVETLRLAPLLVSVSVQSD